MFENFLKVIRRFFFKIRFLSLMSIICLVVGMAICLLSFEYVRYERGFDRFYPNADSIYRVITECYTNNGNELESRYALTMSFLGTKLTRDFPGIEKAARLFFYSDMIVILGEKRFYNKRIFAADPAFLEIFSLPMLYGDAKSALRNPHSLVISESIARSLFGDENPMGKVITLKWGPVTIIHHITGVFKDIPGNSHLTIDIFASFHDLPRWSLINEEGEGQWYFPILYTYVLLKPGTDPRDLEAAFPAFLRKYADLTLKKYGDRKIYLQPLKNIHLESELKGEVGTKVGMVSANLVLWIGIGLFLLILVVFINFLSVRAIERIKEINLRKTLGGDFLHFFKYFFVKSIFYALIAFVISLLLIFVFYKYINKLFGATPPFSIFTGFHFWIDSVLLIIFIASFSGGFLSIIYSSINSRIRSGKDFFMCCSRGNSVRKVFVILQLVVSIVLMTGFFAVQKQINFVLNKDPGFNKENIIILRFIERSGLDSLYVTYKFIEELKKLPTIKNVSFFVIAPGEGHQIGQYIWRKGSMRKIHVQSTFIDFDFFNIFEIKLLAGRSFFSKTYYADLTNMIINESLMKMLGFSKPAEALGNTVIVDESLGFYLRPGEHKIIGVVKDYNQRILKYSIQPAKYHLIPVNKGRFAIKLSSAMNLKETLELIKNTAGKFFPRNEFEHFFLEDIIKNQYKSDIQLKDILQLVSIIAVIIASLGILALSTYILVLYAEENTFRKMARTGIVSSFVTLSKDFVKPIFIAICFAIPIAYIGLKKFLENYAYRIGLHVDLFILPVLVVLVILILILCFQSARINKIKEVESIKYE